MKKVIILDRFIRGGFIDYKKFYEDEFKKNDLEVVFADPTYDLNFFLGNQNEQVFYIGNRPVNLDDVAFIWMYSHGGKMDEFTPTSTLANLLSHTGIKFNNSDLELMRCTGKFYDMMLLSTGGFYIPKTFLVSNPYLFDIDLVEENLSYPVIIKKDQEDRGVGVYKARNREELEYKMRGLKERALIQEFIPNDKDYRYVTGNYKVERVYTRARDKNNKKEFRNNLALGGKEDEVRILDLSSEIVAEVERCSKVFKRQISGIDVIEGGGNQYFIEVNYCPGFQDDTNLKVFVDSILEQI